MESVGLQILGIGEAIGIFTTEHIAGEAVRGTLLVSSCEDETSSTTFSAGLNSKQTRAENPPHPPGPAALHGRLAGGSSGVTTLWCVLQLYSFFILFEFIADVGSWCLLRIISLQDHSIHSKICCSFRGETCLEFVLSILTTSWILSSIITYLKVAWQSDNSLN